jgi:lipid-A-disaccharide synthase
MTAAIARTLRLVNLSHFTLPNLMTELPLVPEFIQEDAQPAAIADAVAAMLDDPERRRLISDEFAKLRQELALDADQRAAESVLALAQS